MEFYKIVAQYRADLEHAQTGQMYDVKAQVLEGPSEGRFHISYSHTFRPTEQAAGMYFSNSFTSASSLDEAEVLVKSWFEQIASSYEVGIWNEDL